jgi:hypothetical protein
MPIADVGRKHEGRMLLDRLAFDALDGRNADHSELLAALGVGKVDGVPLTIEPRTLKAESLHPPETRQQQQPDRAETTRMLALRSRPLRANEGDAFDLR